MKLKSFLFLVCFSLFTNVFAVNLHVNPKADNKDKQSIAKNVTYRGYCQIEIINILKKEHSQIVSVITIQMLLKNHYRLFPEC